MLSATEPMRKFESAAQNLEDQKLPRQMVTLTEGEQPMEQYEMVLFIGNFNTHFKLQFTTYFVNIKSTSVIAFSLYLDLLCLRSVLA